LKICWLNSYQKTKQKSFVTVQAFKYDKRQCFSPFSFWLATNFFKGCFCIKKLKVLKTSRDIFASQGHILSGWGSALLPSYISPSNKDFISMLVCSQFASFLFVFFFVMAWKSWRGTGELSILRVVITIGEVERVSEKFFAG